MSMVNVFEIKVPLPERPERLVAQAVALGMVLVTPDPLISHYPVRVLWW